MPADAVKAAERLRTAVAAVRDRRPGDAARWLLAVDEALAHARDDRDPLRADADALRAYLHRLNGELAKAAATAEAVVARADLPGWSRGASRAAVELGWLARGARDPAQAERWMRSAITFADRAGDPEPRVTSRCGLAEVLSLQGDGRGADRALAEADEISPADPSAQLRLYISRGLVAERLGRPDEAERELQAARRLARGRPTADHEISIALARLALGRGDPVALTHARRAARHAQGQSRRILAAARMLVGEVTRALGRFDAAERAYRAAEALYTPGELFALFARLNRAQVALAQGRADRAHALSAPVRPALALHPAPGAVAALCMVPAVAREEAAGELVSDAISRMRAVGLTHRDVAEGAEAASRALVAAGRLDLAVRLAALAHEQWRRLGNADRAQAQLGVVRTLRADGAPIPLGPFLLDRPLGDGASGHVWRARHAASGERVAVKVLEIGRRGTAARAAFARELRAVAALDHPNVIALLDHGHVDDAAAAAEPSLVTGSPWLAIEYAPHGTLDEHRGRLPWTAFRRMLLEVLDGLGHAHARAIAHLDIKPTNVLLSGDRDQPTAKLADFGLARAPIPFGKVKPTGTPAYMAPEQFGGEGPDLGPWTDLYQLAGLVYAVLGGQPVFGRLGPRELRTAHLRTPPPPLRSRVPVPDGLQDLLDRMLCKDPTKRIRRVPDVVRTLLRLGADGPIEVRSPLRWEDAARSPRPPCLAAAGIGLVSLRRPAMVGRAHERALLWAWLRQVGEQGKAALVTVAGDRGLGARRLARWLVERVTETGAARGITVGPETGIPAFLAEPARALRGAVEPVVIAVLDPERVPGGPALVEAAARLAAPVLVVAAADRGSSWLASADADLELELGPVEDEHLRALVRAYLPVAPALAEGVAARARGSPAEVVRIVRRLAEDRQLVPRPDGWELRPGADLDAVGRSPLDDLRARVAALRPEDRRALDVLRGGALAVQAFEEACLARGIADPAASLERLARAGLLVPGETVAAAEDVGAAL